MQSTHSDAWSGSILFSRDETSVYEPGTCKACTSGLSTAGVLVGGSGNGAKGAECVAGRLCGIVLPWGKPMPVTVLTAGPQYSDAHGAANVLTDRGDTPGKFWLSPDAKTSWFILDLGSTMEARATISAPLLCNGWNATTLCA